ncbi:hypothetical protein AS590_23280 [Prescottella equi]|nr:hypothetical protein AS590_23280 [Prescottella equi]
MAIGAGDKYWEDARLPGVIKHGILRRYLPLYLARTSKPKGFAVHLDGYAGRGFHADGTPGSAGLVINFARERLALDGTIYALRFYEKDKDNYAHLAKHVAEARAAGVDAEATLGDVLSGLDDVLSLAEESSLFMFLDPCGIGLPFETVVESLNRPRRNDWPPTEVLLNFSLEAVRRIGGALAANAAPRSTLQRLDGALGGDWWQQFYLDGYSEGVDELILDEYCSRLSRSTDMVISAVPVRRAPTHKPIYYLVFATRNHRGFWNFSNATAKSVEEWWQRNDAVEENAGNGQLGLWEPPRRPTLDDVENTAYIAIAANITKLLESHDRIVVGDHAIDVLGDYFGSVGEKVVRRSVRYLNEQGLTPSTGAGQRTEAIVVERC